MKIKLNTKQIADISRELKETDRKNFDVTEVTQVFRMLQYWSKTIGAVSRSNEGIPERVPHTAGGRTGRGIIEARNRERI